MKLKLEDRPTKTQRRLLIQHMKDTRHIEGKGKDRKYQWQKITLELNEIGPPKTMAQWKKQWQNMRLSTRKKLQEISRRHPGSPIPELNDEDNEIMEIEASQPDSHFETFPTNSSSDNQITNFKQEVMPSYTVYTNSIEYPQPIQPEAMPSTSSAILPILPPNEPSAVKIRKKYKKKVKTEIPDGGDDNNIPQNYIQPKTKVSMEIKSRTYKGLCEIAKHGKKKKKRMDSDELFLLSFVGELKKIPEYKKLEVKSDIIAIFKKWRSKTQETQFPSEISEIHIEPEPIRIEQLHHQEHQPHENQKLFDLDKAYNPRPVSQLSHHSNSLGGPTSPLNLQQNQTQSNPHHFNTQQHNVGSLLHSVQQLIPPPQQTLQHQLQHQQQQMHQHHSITSLPTQHFPIYQRYGGI